MIERFLKEYGDFLKFTAIERENGIPERTLQHVKDGNRPMPEKHLDKLRQFIKKMAENI